MHKPGKRLNVFLMGVINVVEPHYALTPVNTYMVVSALGRGHLFIAGLGAACSLSHIKCHLL